MSIKTSEYERVTATPSLTSLKWHAGSQRIHLALFCTFQLYDALMRLINVSYKCIFDAHLQYLLYSPRQSRKRTPQLEMQPSLPARGGGEDGVLPTDFTMIFLGSVTLPLRATRAPGARWLTQITARYKWLAPESRVCELTLDIPSGSSPTNARQ